MRRCRGLVSKNVRHKNEIGFTKKNNLIKTEI